MKISTLLLVIENVCLLSWQACAQGSFLNLNFEAANVSGYSPGDAIPSDLAFPGWTTSQYVRYDAFPLGSPAVSIFDNIPGTGGSSLQGQYSAYLFDANGVTVSISQTGNVPDNAATLLLDVFGGNGGFSVSLNGQTLSLTPLFPASGYTIYGADISAFAGQNATLNLLVPPFPSTSNPNNVEFDDIRFSTFPVPEPGVASLSALGAMFHVWRAWRKPLRS